MTKEQAERTLASAKSIERGKPIANNTRLVRDGDAIAVRLHNTNVVTFHGDGSVTLDSGGWHTVTTKERINRYAPCTVYAKRGVWYVSYQGRSHVFLDGIRLCQDGTVQGAGSMTDIAREQKLRKDISAYAREYVKKLYARELPPPGNGDCWGCLFRSEDGRGMMGGHNGHIASHLEEKYHVPSLVVAAVSAFGSQAEKHDVAVCLKAFGATGDEPLFFSDGNTWGRKQLARTIAKWCRRECGIA